MRSQQLRHWKSCPFQKIFPTNFFARRAEFDFAEKNGQKISFVADLTEITTKDHAPYLSTVDMRRVQL